MLWCASAKTHKVLCLPACLFSSQRAHYYPPSSKGKQMRAIPALSQREANACYKHVRLHGVVAVISQKKKAQQLRQDQPG